MWPKYPQNRGSRRKGPGRGHQNGPRGSKKARNDQKPQKLCESIEKIAFLAIFGQNFDHFRPKLGQKWPKMTILGSKMGHFDPILADNGQNLAENGQNCNFSIGYPSFCGFSSFLAIFDPLGPFLGPKILKGRFYRPKRTVNSIYRPFRTVNPSFRYVRQSADCKTQNFGLKLLELNFYTIFRIF